MEGPAYIPTVTMEDLQTFQARHFFGIESKPDARYDENDVDDELGYYPDGVKRTLTDEQIKIFRHSEIQSLLRERRLEEQARLDEPDGDERNTSKEAEIRAETAERSFKVGNHEEDRIRGQPGLSDSKNGRTGGSKREGGLTASAKKKKTRNAGSHDTSMVTLDYDEDIPTDVGSGTFSSGPQASYMGRKMVSYEDDDLEG
ncbi:hypothetical protein FQN54_003383 [Arachnomyces sp. PD_36]|nr:hypothetical protein FQN54_003383 [Arachnomyces sp. PD_36]